MAIPFSHGFINLGAILQPITLKPPNLVHIWKVCLPLLERSSSFFPGLFLNILGEGGPKLLNRKLPNQIIFTVVAFTKTSL